MKKQAINKNFQNKITRWVFIYFLLYNNKYFTTMLNIFILFTCKPLKQ